MMLMRIKSTGRKCACKYEVHINIEAEADVVMPHSFQESFEAHSLTTTFSCLKHIDVLNKTVRQSKT